MNISVFGIGYVGCISLGCLAEDGHTIIGVDTNKAKLALINSGKPTVVENDIKEIILKGVYEGKISATDDYNYAVQNSDISIICVGTPLGENGSLDLSHIFKVTEQIGEALKTKKDFHIISIRSSVPPGTINKIEKVVTNASGKLIDKDFSVLANPEFLREGSAVYDYYNPSYTLIGGSNKDSMAKLASIYKNVKAEIIFTKVEEAELIKFVNNSFHALKVSFANEIGNICSALEIDSFKFMELFVKDTKLNISPSYLKPGFAFGGSCLPKDLKSLENLAKQVKVSTPVLSGISESNDAHIEKAFKLIMNTKKKSVGFIGITFKEGTDDVRNSPYITLIKKLLSEQIHISIFDTNLDLENIIGANKEYLLKELPNISEHLVNSFKELLHESEVIVLANSKLVTLKEIKSLKNKTVIDLIRIDENLRTKDNYIGLSW